MAVKYFEYFPTVTFNNVPIIDITRRVNISSTILSDPYVFLPYTIKDEDRPEDIALYYYDDVKYVWLVYLSINAIDPYYDWPLRHDQLEKFIIKKYAAQANATGNAVLSWAKNTTISENIIHYQNLNDDTIISKDSVRLNSQIDADEWQAVRAYDYELQLNEDKRVIELLDRRYASQAEIELKELLNG